MECDADRMRLASIDDERFLRDIINDANRSNTTLLSDRSARPGGVRNRRSIAGLPLDADAELRRTHQESMRTLADGTDGIAVVDTNDLDKGLRQISDDLHLLLPARLLLDQHQARWRLPVAEGEGHAAQASRSGRGAAIARRAPRRSPGRADRGGGAGSRRRVPRCRPRSGCSARIRPESRIRASRDAPPGTNTCG